MGIQLIDYPATTARSFHFHDLVVANNALGGITWQCCGDTVEDLEGWPGPEPVLIERATIVGNGGPGVEGGASGAMALRESIVWQNAPDLYLVGGPLGTNRVGADPIFRGDFRLSLGSPRGVPGRTAAISAPSPGASAPTARTTTPTERSISPIRTVRASTTRASTRRRPLAVASARSSPRSSGCSRCDAVTG